MSGAALRYFKWRLLHGMTCPASLRGIDALYRRLRRAKGYYLSVESFGARAAMPGKPQTRSLASLVRASATPPWKGHLLYSLVRYVRPNRILELGTHLGFSTMYLAAAAPDADLHTIEASPTLAEKAKQHFRLLGIQPHLHIGTFEQILPTLQGEWDFIYIDGDHRGASLYQYGILLYGRLRKGGLLVCDDIFWSRDMYAGWRRLCQYVGGSFQVIGPLGVLRA